MIIWWSWSLTTSKPSRSGMSGSGFMNHENVIQQLNQRKSDPNLTLIVHPVEASQNALECYLAEIGPLQRHRLGDFEALSEGEYEDWLWASDKEDVQGEGVIEITDDEDEVQDASGLVAGADQPGMGGRN
ncbi:hypothetical protein ACET3Z_011816 [Daucus carota]